MAIGDSIKHGHDEYRRIFAKLFKTTEKEAELRQQLFLDYANRLYAHHEAENKTILPEMLKVPDLKDMAYEIMEEHAAMKLLIKNLKQQGYDAKMWRYALSPLFSIMLVHWEKEETQLIPFAPQYFSGIELNELGKKFDDVVGTYLKEHRL